MQVAFPNWSASVARTVAIVQPSASQLRGVTTAVVPLAWPTRAPVEILDYTLDLGAWLQDADDVVVAASAFVSPQASDVDLTIVWITILDGNLTALLSGGVPGTTYAITFVAQSAMGRTASFDVSMLINSTATAVTTVASPTPIQLPSAAALLPNGTQLLLGGTPLLLNTGSSARAPISPPAIAPNTPLLMPDGSDLLFNGAPLLLNTAPVASAPVSSAALAPNTLSLLSNVPLVLDTGLPLILA